MFSGGIVFVGRAVDIYGDKLAVGKGIPNDLCTAAPWWSDSDINSFDNILNPDQHYIGV
jgi:hypothetical protein